jgi:hypothetical protein
LEEKKYKNYELNQAKDCPTTMVVPLKNIHIVDVNMILISLTPLFLSFIHSCVILL